MNKLYEVTFLITVEKEVTYNEIQNWADNVVTMFREQEKDSESTIRVIYINEEKND